MSSCICGKDGVHDHQVDGDRVVLCPNCHAALRMIMMNSSKTSAVSYIYRAFNEDDSIIEMYAAEEPKPLSITPRREIVVEEQELEPVHSIVDGCSVFLPLRSNHNEVRRSAPEVE